MPSEIFTAIIAAIVGTISAVITLSIGLGQLRNERERLNEDMRIERKKLEHDRERLQVELRENAEQTRVWKAEVEKLKAETQKLSLESDDIRRRRLEAERQEIRNLLVLFDRAVFDAAISKENPVEMYMAIQQTRISIQTNGASLVKDHEIAERFQDIRKILLTAETEVKEQFPLVVQLASEINTLPTTGQYNQLSYEQHTRHREVLGDQFYRSAHPMMGVRDKIRNHINAIIERLRLLDEKIG
jgi:cell division protein FtsL